MESGAVLGFWPFSERLRCDNRGVVLALVALAATALLAITGLAVDVGWWYTIQRQNQSAADAAAISAAYELAGNPAWTAAQLTPFATAAATLNGYAGSTPAVTYPCGGSCLAADSAGIQVVLQQAQNSWFASLAGLNSVTIANRAVALVTTGSNPCLFALNPTANNAINVAGNPTINAPSCTVFADSNSNSAVHLQGGATIDAATVMTHGEIATTGGAYTLNLTLPAQTGAPFLPDPYATGPNALTHSFLITGMPTAPAPCAPPKKPKATWPGNCVLDNTKSAISVGDTLTGNTQIVGGLKFNNGTVNLSPGTYWITEGDLTLDNSKATLQCPTCANGGAGVTVIMTTAKASGGTVGAVTLNSQANLNLNSPSSGNFAGLVLIQDGNSLPPGTTIPNPTNNMQANATETLTGLVYFPKSAITFQGTPSATGPQCLVVVADTITLQGNATIGFATSGCSNLGLVNLPTVKTVALRE